MQFIKSLLVLVIISFFTSASFAQLDPIQYQGPADGSVASGVIQTTDNFTIMEVAVGPPKIIPLLEVKESAYEEPIIEWDESLLPEYVYVEDANATKNPNVSPESTVLLSSFKAIPMTGSIPPDAHLAVGPNHIIACVNSRFAIYDKEGNMLKNIDAEAWISPVIGSGAFDPQIIYDHYEERWFMLWDWQDNGTQQGYFIISYSDDNDPIGTWYMYLLNAKLNGSQNGNIWGDYPQVGYDDEAIYIDSRSVSFSGAGIIYDKIRILDKSELYIANGGQVNWTDIWDIRAPNSTSYQPDVIHPTISYTPGQGGWFFWAHISGRSYYYAYKIANPLTSPVLTGRVIPVQYYGPTPPTNQLGGGTIENGGSKIRTNPVIRDGFLYGAHSVRNSTATAYSSARYFKFNLSTTVIDEVGELGASGYYYIYPAITVDQDHNLAVTFSRSADTEYIGAYYSSKLAADPPGLQPSQPMAEGEGNYVVTYGGTRNRWGDYMGACIDPENFYDAWLLCEYAAATNTWSTWISEIRMAPYSGAHAYAESFTVDLGNIELGTAPATVIVPFSNYGDADLTINTITSPVGPFTLLSNLSLPYTLPPYDSLLLEFEFDPTSATVYEELMVFDNNDPDFPGFTMKGRGYTMNPAFTEYVYASTGAADTGKTVWLDRTTGSGTELGLSNFPLIRGLAIDPTTNIMYGTVAGGSESQVVRVNAYNGDAYTLYSLPLGTMVGIAFDNSGTCYVGLQNGEIYTVDLITGNYTLVTSTIQLTSITINPSDNQMWASPRVVVGIKDKIYTIDLTTGDATLIGQTGFTKLTNDLTFDETGTLYGVIGGTSEEGELISINTSDATGTLIGATGFTDVQGLAYTVTGGPPVSVDDVNTTVPTEFSLEQNYPNPFNPATKIKFTISDLRFTILKVYDILGSEVAILVNEERPAGTYEVEFDASSLPSGIYFYKLQAGSFVETKKMVLLK